MTKVPIKKEAKKPEPAAPINFQKEIAEQVMTKLGKPENFYKCKVTQITPTEFRVNVWNKGSMGAGKITDSFFVRINKEGMIISPEIKKKYTK